MKQNNKYKTMYEYITFGLCYDFKIYMTTIAGQFKDLKIDLLLLFTIRDCLR